MLVRGAQTDGYTSFLYHWCLAGKGDFISANDHLDIFNIGSRLYKIIRLTLAYGIYSVQSLTCGCFHKMRSNDSVAHRYDVFSAPVSVTCWGHRKKNVRFLSFLYSPGLLNYSLQWCGL